MKNWKILLPLLVLWVTSVTFAYITGRSIPLPQSAEKDPMSVRQKTGKRSGVKHELSVSSEKVSQSDAGTIVQGDNVPDNTPGLTDAFNDASGIERYDTQSVRKMLMDNNPVRRMTDFMRMIQGLDSSNVGEALSAFENLSNPYERRDEFNLLLYAWGGFDGQAAVEYVVERKDERSSSSWRRSRDSYYALSGWAGNDPDDALKWALENHEGEDNPYLVGVVGGIADTDIYKASEIMQMLPYGRNRSQAVDVLVKGFLQQSPEEAKQWAEGLSEAALRDGVVSRMAWRLADSDPQGTADWIMSVSEGEGLKKSVVMLSNKWASRSPEEAAAWTDSLEDDQLCSEAMAQVARQWARKDVEATAEWLNQYPPSGKRDKAVINFAYTISRTNAETALFWANTVQDKTSRRSTVDSIMRSWTRRDPDAAAKFVETIKAF
ncbi:hypothetical protein ACFLS1_02645 [Verrucomicrobiota bacterium]